MTEELQRQSTVERSSFATWAIRRLRIGRFVANALGSLAFFSGLIGLWHLAVASGMVSEIILPLPRDVGQAVIDTLQDSFFYKHLWATTSAVIVGFLLGSAIGFVLGMVTGASRWARDISYPFIIAFQGLPKVVLAPLFITAFGLGLTSKVTMVVAISFFPVLINVMVSLASVDPDALLLMRSLNASRLHIFTKLVLPQSLPLIFAGLKTSLTLALVGAIVAEFAGASRGLGYLLEVYSYQLQVARAYAVMIILSSLGVALFLCLEWLDRRLVFWKSERGLIATM